MTTLRRLKLIILHVVVNLTLPIITEKEFHAKNTRKKMDEPKTDQATFVIIIKNEIKEIR